MDPRHTLDRARDVRSMQTRMSADEPATRPALDALADPAVRRELEQFVRRRVPASDVEDVVQTILCDALASVGRPTDPAELRRWLIGIARHKVADAHRRASRERPDELPDLAAPPPPVEERELASWAERQAGSSRDAKQTLAWMAREGEGDKLERIAAEENVPAARVRQRVSRMRRWMKERWLAELALVAALGVIAFIVYEVLRRSHETPIAVPEPAPSSAAPTPPSPLDRARALRADAFERCDAGAWRACLDAFDEAKALDPAGDESPDVAQARQRATDALSAPLQQRPEAPSPLPSSLPPKPKAAPPKAKPVTTSSLDPELMKKTGELKKAAKSKKQSVDSLNANPNVKGGVTSDGPSTPIPQQQDLPPSQKK